MKNKKYMIVENLAIDGRKFFLAFEYHIGLTDQPSRSLCGLATVPTRIPLSQYKASNCSADQWCEKCLKLKENHEKKS